MIQQLRICLALQGTWVWSLFRKLRSHMEQLSPCAIPTESTRNNYRVHVLQRKIPHDATKRINKWKRFSQAIKDHSKYRWANADVGGVQTVLCKIRLKNQAGVDHAMIRLLKKCKRQSKMLNKNIHIVRISTGINDQFPQHLPPHPKMYCKGKKKKGKLILKMI